MVEPLYQVQLSCICCGNVFKTSRVRPSFKKAIRSDTDFCLYYKDVNPDYYVVRVCPHCGFATTENFSDRLPPAQKDAYYEKVGKKWTKRDYGGERSWEDALATYKLALLCAQIKSERMRVVAGLLHHIAWLYRYKGDAEEEIRFLRHALDAYVNVYETEKANLNDARLMYLIGELNRRLGHYHEAVRWFSRVVHDVRIVDSAMIQASRQQWAATREEMAAARMELPDGMELQP